MRGPILTKSDIENEKIGQKFQFFACSTRLQAICLKKDTANSTITISMTSVFLNVVVKYMVARLYDVIIWLEPELKLKYLCAYGAQLEALC